MVGLMSSTPTMRTSVDNYFDQYNFMDIQLYSSYGFDDDDIAVLRKADNIDDVFATKFTDVFVKNDESTIITRVQEIDSSINEFELLEGRMPKKTTEALALGSSSYGTVFTVGDKVDIYLEDEDLSETLVHTEYEIVGVVRTPQYMCSSKETSTLDNLTLSTVIYVDNDNFLNDYYTSVYLTFNGSKEYNSFDDEYDQFIEENLDELEDIIKKQETVRRDEVIAEVTQEIADGEKELEEKISDAQAEIDDAKKELDDAYIQILVGEAQLKSSEKQMTSGSEEIEKNKKTIKDAEKQISDAKSQIAKESDMTYDEAATSIKAAYGVYVMVNNMLADPENTPEATISKSIQEKNDEIDYLTAENNDLKNQNKQLNDEISALQNSLLILIDDSSSDSSSESTDNSSSESSSESTDSSSSDSTSDSDSSSDSSNNINDLIDKKQQAIAKNEVKIAENEERISQLRTEIFELQSVKSLVGDATLAEIPAMIDDMFGGSVTNAYNGILKLEDAESELEYGKKQLSAAETEIKTGQTQLEDTKKQLEDGRKEYEDGVKKLEDAQKELDEEYEKARVDIDKAKQELAELPDASWTVLSRDEHYSTAMFKSNADQMQRIGNVFPMLFCLVAALVCMTTMKRLVDEQRSQIGVFSAIGFSKNQIIGKYILYALAASLIGSGVGIPIGVFSLPWVIYFCWRMMYDLPVMVLTMPAYISVIGVSLFTFLMVWVTFTVVKSVLKECPSQLMRPKAPRTAKKVFLENIPFIWKHLSFTSKVTARNIIRYKSRFFMTVIGVAGCTSLLVLGFAIKGSISQVITRQYGDILHYDTIVTMEDHSYTENILEELENDHKVEFAVPYMTYSTMAYCDAQDKAVQVYVMDEDDIHDIIKLQQRKNKEKLDIADGVVISEKFAKICGIKVGDEITIESDDGIKKDVEVTGICEMYTNHFLFISDEYYTDTFNETVYKDCIAVTSTDSAGVVKEFEDFEGVKTIDDFSDTIATFSSMLETLDIIVVVLIIAAGSLALVVIMNLTEVNISERIREIATLKVLGFNNKEVYSYIFKEVFFLSLFGMILGLPLGRLEL
ncbi:MAG: ABC transporter permease, partial [Oscillospiraceae bacterium]|nr:ABC transporter permease [Oscillospiraceae bacterium]